MKKFLDSRINVDLFKFNVRNKKGLILFYTLILSLTFPVVIIVSKLSNSSYQAEVTDITSLVIFLSIVFALLLIFTPFLFFNYLNSKKSVDVFHSLSISRNDLYLTYTALSLFFVLLPLTIAYWTGYILSYTLLSIPFDPYHIFHFGRLIMISIAIMAPSIFVIMNTGTLADSLVYTAILFVAPFIAYAAFQLFAEVNIIGFSSGSAESLTYLSPIVGVVGIYEDVLSNVDGHVVASYWFLLGLGMSIISMNIYSNWKSECSEVPFSNKSFFPFVTSLFIGILFIFLLSLNVIPNPRWIFFSVENLLIPIVFTYALFLVLYFIKDRSIDSIKKASKNYWVLFVVIMLVSTSLYFSQGFGFTYKIPKEKDIVSIELNPSNQYEPFLSENNIVLESEEDIKNFIKIHEEIVSYAKKDKKLFSQQAESDLSSELSPYGVSGDYSNFSFIYNLKNNGKIKRSYKIPSELQHILFELALNKDVLHSNHPITNPRFSNFEDLNITNPFFTKGFNTGFLDQKEIQNNIIKDFENINYKEYYNASSHVQFILTYSSNHQIYQLNIDARFENTLKLLSNYQLDEVDYNEFSISYKLVDKSEVSDKYTGHGLSQVIQQNRYDFYEDHLVKYLSFEEVIKYEDKIFDNYLNKEGNSVLVIESPFGEITFPIIDK